MRFFILPLFFLFCLSAKALDVSISHAQFSSEGNSYVEINLQVIGKTAVFIPMTLDSLLSQASLNVLIYLEQNGEITAHEKYTLQSPSISFPVDLIKMHRFPVPSGRSFLVIEIVDNHDILNKFDYKQELVGLKHQESIYQSDIQLFAKAEASTAQSELSKNGFSFEVLPYDYLQGNLKELIFYNEVYQSQKNFDENFLLSFKINIGYFGEFGQTVKQGYKKLAPAASVPILKKLKVDDLISGNYHLVLEVLDRDKNLYSSKYINFRRSNPDADYSIANNYNKEYDNSFVHKLEKDKLNYYLKALIPVAQSNLLGILNGAVSRDDAESKRYFIFKYFNDNYGQNAELGFNQYMKVADAVHDRFASGFGYGFETDRGYIFMKYGNPNDALTVEDEPSAPPYEIWVYNKIIDTNQSNVKFIFYNPSLSHNDFELLHSTCRGELNNPAWEVELYKSALSEDNRRNVNSTTVQPGINRNARRYFNDL